MEPDDTTRRELATPPLGDDEEVWCVVRTASDVLVGTDRRMFRVRPDGIDEWTYGDIDGIYPIGSTGMYILNAQQDPFAIAIPEGPAYEANVQGLAVMSLLVGLAHRERTPAHR